MEIKDGMEIENGRLMKLNYIELANNFYNPQWWIDNWDLLSDFEQSFDRCQCDDYNQNAAIHLSNFLNGSWIVEHSIVKLYDDVLTFRDGDRHDYLYRGRGNHHSDCIDCYGNFIEIKSIKNETSRENLWFDKKHDSNEQIFYVWSSGKLWHYFDGKWELCQRQFDEPLQRFDYEKLACRLPSDILQKKRVNF